MRLAPLGALLFAGLLTGGCQEAMQILADAAANPQAAGSRGGMRSGCQANTTFQCAQTVSAGRVQGVLTDYNQYYAFTVREPRRVFVTLDPMPNNRGMSVGLYDAEYRRLGSEGFRAGQPGRFSVVVERPGRVYVLVDPGWGSASPSDTYTITLSR